jgi:hypothetical protein
MWQKDAFSTNRNKDISTAPVEPPKTLLIMVCATAVSSHSSPSRVVDMAQDVGEETSHTMIAPW